MNWLDQHKFSILLVSISLLLVVYPLVQPFYEGRLFFDGLVAFVYIAVILGLFRKPRHRWAAFLLGIPALVGNWIHYALPDEVRFPFAIVSHIWGAVFLLFTVVSILVTVYAEDVVTLDGVFGAFCGYLLLGLAFSHIYCIQELASPGSFPVVQRRVGTSVEGAHLRFFLLTYFSFGAITTAGAGDLTASTDAARSLAIVETILGQFYMAGLIAELIGKKVSQKPATAATEEPPTAGAGKDPS